MNALAANVGGPPLFALCAALEVPRSTLYRHRRAARACSVRAKPPRALSEEERGAILEHLHSERFVDRAPAEVVHTLLADGIYLGSERTMYRILADNDEVRERRRQRTHPVYAKPELMATAPNQVWSWDITRLRTTRKWEYLYLYVVIDIFSRAVVGWMVAEKETAALAWRLIDETVEKQGIRPGTLVLHADRGTQMTSKTVAQLLADLDVGKSHSRPQVSNDNPFSESQFKTLKYHSSFPGKFVGVDDAVSFCREFFAWYNDEHRHSGIAHLTPNDVHNGRADEQLAARHEVMMGAWRAHPERFVRGQPRRQVLAPAVYINPPAPPAAPPSSSSSPSETERSEVGAMMTGMVVPSRPSFDSEPSHSGGVH
jgi:putative transposase